MRWRPLNNYVEIIRNAVSALHIDSFKLYIRNANNDKLTIYQQALNNNLSINNPSIEYGFENFTLFLGI